MLPSKPVGLTTKTRTKRPNSTTGTQLTGMKVGMMPSRPPRNRPSQEGPQGITQTAQDTDNKGFQLIGGATQDGEGKEGGGKGAGHRGQRGAQTEGQGQDVVRGNAHQLRRRPVIGHGPDGLARTGEIEEQIEGRGDDHCGQGRQQPGALQDNRAEGNGTHREIDIPGGGGEERGADADNDHVHREGGQQGVEITGLDHPLQGHPVNQETEEHGQEHHHHQPQIGVQRQIAEEEVGAEHPQGHGGAVAQVDDPHHAPDQGQAHGGHAVYEADEQAVNDGGQQMYHFMASRLAKNSPGSGGCLPTPRLFPLTPGYYG